MSFVLKASLGGKGGAVGLLSEGGFPLISGCVINPIGCCLGGTWADLEKHANLEIMLV